MSKVVCVECEKEMKPKEVGVKITEYGGDGKPYKIWVADLLECPKCGKQVITRFADNPYIQRPDDRLSEQSVLTDYKF